MTESIYAAHLLKQGFVLNEQIGTGLSGETRKGFQKSLNRNVAIKFFNNKLHMNNESLRKRFYRESKILAELQHPSIPFVITNGTIKTEASTTPYFVMQYISGMTLKEYIKKHAPVSLDIALHISSQVLDALAFVHKQGIVHRDIKPANIMILPSGHCYLIDFSIGFKIEPVKGMTRVTQVGDGLGDYLYMAPEQVIDMGSVDHRADIYSFSLVLCELLSSKPSLTQLNRCANSYPPALINSIAKGCNHEAEDRHTSASNFMRELRQVSFNTLPNIDSPSNAICINTKCPSANWSDRGFYRGIYFIENSTNIHCTSCGQKLIYQCQKCGNPVENTMHCGGCGNRQFSVPKCKQCKSFLKEIDMDDDTELKGCDKCRNKKKPQQKSQDSKINFDESFDDDIPF